MKLRLQFLDNIKHLAGTPLPVTASSSASCPPGQLPKGLHGIVLRVANQWNLHSRESLVYQGKYMYMRFFPTWHFLSLFRKTRPAVSVKFNKEMTFLNECGTYLQTEYAKRKSVIPADYAVWRRKITMYVKSEFIRQWRSLNTTTGSFDASGGTPVGVAKDGYYIVHLSKMPSNDELPELQREINAAVTRTAELSWDSILKTKPATTDQGETATPIG
ncbi:Pet130p KNAG_0B05010 [Huiozyma naganishii CBS 8797]|uniref:Uncharacterized protein n=1 Tax=Huiozyma naganishii (strain ATCC MYA-139 / BCRC 22969 / CBS 8797 / KCTC 17520 / NBRC 10181 / NCYC 3082 / Yp74L-3) TaxID=1071383 RepID=J7R295_HUIN7|nr:hypothetical protein KNAG_0B05010 [Kazachstania naganishii CBS 8797]CCK68935.1 hypothetical protein KNAG_0B05010 [Kazachstania naganishii CBS 8797]